MGVMVSPGRDGYGVRCRGGSLLLIVGVGVVSLTLQGGAELDVGAVVGAGFADRLEGAVEFDGVGPLPLLVWDLGA